jgi:predicted NAD/FAD-dependent oxidoreductase
VLSGQVGAPGVTLGPREPTEDLPLTAFGTFDVLLVCLPADQAHSLVRGVHASMADIVARASCEPCLALGFVPQGDALRDLPFDGLFIGRDGDPDRTLSWLARDSSKPGRQGDDTWVLHAAPDWSRAHLRDPRERVEERLLGELSRLLRLPPIRSRASTLRRWAYARAPSMPSSGPLFDDVLRCGVGGDWSLGGRVEGAFLSGLALAGRVLGLPEETSVLR